MNTHLNRPRSGLNALIISIVYVLTLLVANVALCFTEELPLAVAVVNILLPGSFYFIVLSLGRRTGMLMCLLFPFAVLSAFQIVLLFLYGNSIIAVDMFLNVVTTNMSEATELLANLGTAILTVVIIYLPMLLLAVMLWVKGRGIETVTRHRVFLIAMPVFVAMLSLAGFMYIVTPSFRFSKDVFPVNVVYNMKVAFDRSAESHRYPLTSAGFKYDAKSLRPDSLPEVYVMVIGETSRADNWQLAGYGRETNPRLSRRRGVCFFPKALSESNTTHKSVPMLMSYITAADFGDISQAKSIITAFKEAGYKTLFVSTQAPNRSYNEYFGNEAHEVVWLGDTLGRHRYDGEMLPVVERFLAQGDCCKKFVVLHSYGSHFKYTERYPAECERFTPSRCEEVSVENRPRLLNAYDNSILYTDEWLDRLMGMLERTGKVAALAYASDHGEDILDDDRERFLHASPTPTYYQLHVAMLTWVSDPFSENFADKCNSMALNCHRRVSSTSSLFNTMLDLAGIATSRHDESLSLASNEYKEPSPLYLNDHNEAIALENSGLKSVDFEKLRGIIGFGVGENVSLAQSFPKIQIK